MASHQSLACACGQVRLTATGQPIATVECCCDSCRKAGAMLQSSPEHRTSWARTARRSS